MSDCGVCIGGWDSGCADMEGVEFRNVTAKRAYRCCECQRVMPAGEEHEHVDGKWDGEYQSYRFCLVCSEIQTVFSCGQDRLFTALWDDMKELVFPELTTANKCFLKLSAKSKAFLLKRWNEWKFVSTASTPAAPGPKK